MLSITQIQNKTTNYECVKQPNCLPSQTVSKYKRIKINEDNLSEKENKGNFTSKNIICMQDLWKH